VDSLSLAVAGLALVGGLAGLVGLLVRAQRAEGRALETLAATEAKQALLERRFSGVLDVEAETARVRESLSAERTAAEQQIAKLRSEADALRQQYSIAYQRHQSLDNEVRGLEESLEDISYGLYKPHFTYDDSDAYKRAIADARDDQKAMIRSGDATHCGTEWQVGGSKAEGRKLIKQYEKLILRAFNAESDACIANVSWNNFGVMEARIRKAHEALGKLGDRMNVSVTPAYRDARLGELRLVFESAEKRQKEREEQRRQRAEQREEERVQRELEKERAKAEQEELRYEKALETARAELATSIDAERESMLARVQALESDLAEAHSRKERAIAQAQLTRVGHVYVVSNLGAFGEGVVKIGLTRRLDPEERVKELGDASVPFPFDLHALVYSEDAPALETKLHTHFWDKRLNWANDRKEFFRATLNEVHEALHGLGLEAKVLHVPEAREYRESMETAERSRTTKSSARAAPPARGLPEDPFDQTSVPAQV